MHAHEPRYPQFAHRELELQIEEIPIGRTNTMVRKASNSRVCNSNSIAKTICLQKQFAYTTTLWIFRRVLFMHLCHITL